MSAIGYIVPRLVLVTLIIIALAAIVKGEPTAATGQALQVANAGGFNAASIAQKIFIAMLISITGIVVMLFKP